MEMYIHGFAKDIIGVKFLKKKCNPTIFFIRCLRMEDEVIIYNWNCVGDTLIVRPPTRQLRIKSGCLFAAIARHVEYQLRIACAPQNLIATDLIDQSILANQFENSKPSSYKTTVALKHFHNNGITLHNGIHIQVKFGVQFHVFAKEENDIIHDLGHFCTVIHELGKWLERGTLLGKLVIRSDYRVDGNHVYLGVGERRMSSTHLIVIIGLFLVCEMLG